MNVFGQINQFIEQSGGEYIDVAQKAYRFIKTKQYEPQDIIAFEKEHQITLPKEYQEFLLQVGACQLYVDCYELGIVFYELSQIKHITAECFYGFDNPFPNLLLIGANLNNGDFIGYNLTQSSERALSVYSIMTDYPERWFELQDFTTLSALLDKLVSSGGWDIG